MEKKGDEDGEDENGEEGGGGGKLHGKYVYGGEEEGESFSAAEHVSKEQRQQTPESKVVKRKFLGCTTLAMRRPQVHFRFPSLHLKI